MTEAGSSIKTVIQADLDISRQEGILDTKFVIIMIMRTSNGKIVEHNYSLE